MRFRRWRRSGFFFALPLAVIIVPIRETKPLRIRCLRMIFFNAFVRTGCVLPVRFTRCWAARSLIAFIRAWGIFPVRFTGCWATGSFIAFIRAWGIFPVRFTRCWATRSPVRLCSCWSAVSPTTFPSTIWTVPIWESKMLIGCLRLIG